MHLSRGAGRALRALLIIAVAVVVSLDAVITDVAIILADTTPTTAESSLKTAIGGAEVEVKLLDAVAPEDAPRHVTIIFGGTNVEGVAARDTWRQLTPQEATAAGFDSKVLLPMVLTPTVAPADAAVSVAGAVDFRSELVAVSLRDEMAPVTSYRNVTVQFGSADRSINFLARDRFHALPEREQEAMGFEVNYTVEVPLPVQDGANAQAVAKLLRSKMRLNSTDLYTDGEKTADGRTIFVFQKTRGTDVDANVDKALRHLIVSAPEFNSAGLGPLVSNHAGLLSSTAVALVAALITIAL